MKFSINIGGLIYNIESLTNKFYEVNALSFNCSYKEDGFDIQVTNEELTSFTYYDNTKDIYENEVAFILDKVIKHCLDYNRLIIHGAAISYKNNGYLFIAPSGTGKTTHIKLWKKYLKDEVTIISGDKPMLEFNDKVIIHGSPWNGKENLGTNSSVPLKSIIILKQAKTNNLTIANSNNSILNLLSQTFYSIDKLHGPKVVKYIEKLVKDIPIYQLECDISKKAFETCFNGLISE